jgi:hypothetical protein
VAVDIAELDTAFSVLVFCGDGSVDIEEVGSGFLWAEGGRGWLCGELGEDIENHRLCSKFL